MDITKEQFPALYEACDIISHDGGGRSGHKAYVMPGIEQPQATAYNEALGKLSEDDLLDFCLSDETEIAVMADGNEALGLAHHALNVFFDNGSLCAVCS